MQYVELCGFKKGQNQHSMGDNRLPISQEQIAKELGISHRVLKELLEIERKLTSEIKELLDTGIITKTLAKIFPRVGQPPITTIHQ